MASHQESKDGLQPDMGSGPLPMPQDLERVAASLLADLVARFPLRHAPRIVWKPYRVSAGKAYLRENVIGLSRRLLTTHERVRATLLHEFAHLLAVERHGPAGAGHGMAWRKAMEDVGAPAEVYHRYAVCRNRRRQTVVYACGTCGARFETPRRFPRGRRYAHRGCGGVLRLVRVERLPESE